MINTKNTSWWIIHLGLISLSAAIIYICLGVGYGQWTAFSDIDGIILKFRVPRIEVAVLVGAALAMSGCALQALFENPLADPSLIGTSSGAALGVVIALSLGVTGTTISIPALLSDTPWTIQGDLLIPAVAFLGSCLVCLMILAIYKIVGGGQVGLLIIGFIISAFSAAAVNFMLFMSNDMVLRTATVWLTGSLANAGYVPIHYATFIIVLGMLILIPLGRQLDALMLGEAVAKSMGIKVQKTRAWVIIASALLTSAAVSMAGVIGFVGMMIPNVLAVLLGGSRTRLMIYSAWLGGIFLLIVDTTARYFAYPVDIPVGIVVALIGAPFFLWLFLQSIRGRSS